MKPFRYIALLTAALCLSAFTACGSQGPSMSEGDLPYGATMREDKSSYAVPVTYDRRFLEEAQLTAVANYLSAIQTSDAALYESVTLDFYSEHQLNDIYAGQYANMDEMVAALHKSIADTTADDYAFRMVTIEDCTTEQITSGLNTILQILENIDESDNFEETVDACWALNMEWILGYTGGSLIVSDQKLYLLEIDGKYYCVM